MDKLSAFTQSYEATFSEDILADDDLLRCSEDMFQNRLNQLKDDQLLLLQLSLLCMLSYFYDNNFITDITK